MSVNTGQGEKSYRPGDDCGFNVDTIPLEQNAELDRMITGLLSTRAGVQE